MDLLAGSAERISVVSGKRAALSTLIIRPNGLSAGISDKSPQNLMRACQPQYRMIKDAIANIARDRNLPSFPATTRPKYR
jgi:hypothetical protein